MSKFKKIISISLFAGFAGFAAYVNNQALADGDLKSEVPLNSHGAVDVNAHVPLEVQIPMAPKDQINPVPKSLASKFSNDLPAQPNLNVKSYLLTAANSNQIIASYNSYKRVPPASLAKLMLIYIVEQHLASGDLKLDQKIRVPKVAWATGGSRMFLKPGSYVSVKELINGTLVASGNDAAVTLAVHIAGTQDSFVHLMNSEAKKLGMNNTRYATVMGLPAPNEYTCAYDLSLLARSIMLNYPQYFPWFKQKWITHNDIKQPNYNKLLFIYPDATGMKTGSTSYAGYSLVGTAKEDGNPMPLIAVVLGADNRMASANGAKALLKYGFHFFKSKLFYSDKKLIKQVPLYLGKKDLISVGVTKPIWVSYPKDLKDKVQAQLKVDKNLKAPIKKGQVLGKVIFSVKNSVDSEAGDSDGYMNSKNNKKKHDDILLKSVPVVSMEDINLGGLFKRTKDHVKLWWS